MNNEIIVEMYQKSDCDFEKENLLNDLILANQKLCHKVVNKFKNNLVEYDDAFQICMIGMAKAAEKFDFSKGLKFVTAAYTFMFYELTTYSRSKKARKIADMSLDYTYEGKDQQHLDFMNKYLSYEEEHDDIVNAEIIKDKFIEFAKNNYKNNKLKVAMMLINGSDISNDDAAEILGITANAVNVHKGRIKKDLRKRFSSLLEC